jgi:hypothetical protein
MTTSQDLQKLMPNIDKIWVEFNSHSGRAFGKNNSVETKRGIADMDRFEKHLPLLSESPNTPVNKLMDEYMSAWSCLDGMMPLARTRVIAEMHRSAAATPADKAKACVDLAVIDLAQAQVFERWESREDLTPGPCDQSQSFRKEAKELLQAADKLAPQLLKIYSFVPCSRTDTPWFG